MGLFRAVDWVDWSLLGWAGVTPTCHDMIMSWLSNDSNDNILNLIGDMQWQEALKIDLPKLDQTQTPFREPGALGKAQRNAHR